MKWLNDLSIAGGAATKKKGTVFLDYVKGGGSNNIEKSVFSSKSQRNTSLVSQNY